MMVLAFDVVFGKDTETVLFYFYFMYLTFVLKALIHGVRFQVWSEVGIQFDFSLSSPLLPSLGALAPGSTSLPGCAEATP